MPRCYAVVISGWWNRPQNGIVGIPFRNPPEFHSARHRRRWKTSPWPQWQVRALALCIIQWQLQGKQHITGGISEETKQHVRARVFRHDFITEGTYTYLYFTRRLYTLADRCSSSSKHDFPLPALNTAGQSNVSSFRCGVPKADPLQFRATGPPLSYPAIPFWKGRIRQGGCTFPQHTFSFWRDLQTHVRTLVFVFVWLQSAWITNVECDFFTQRQNTYRFTQSHNIFFAQTGSDMCMACIW